MLLPARLTAVLAAGILILIGLTTIVGAGRSPSRAVVSAAVAGDAAHLLQPDRLGQRGVLSRHREGEMALTVLSRESGAIRYVDSARGSDDSDCRSADAPCATIAYAVSQADPADEIRVAAGRYDESLEIDKPLHLHGAGAARTTIHALPGRRVLDLRCADGVGAVGARMVISGFELTGGAPLEGDGGAVRISGCRGATIAHSAVVSNTIVMTGNGAGLALVGADSVHVYGSRFADNRTTAGHGGAIYISSTTGAHITTTVLLRNRAGIFHSGGALYMEEAPDGTIAYSELRDNQASAGGAIYARRAPRLEIAHNRIADNIADHAGPFTKHGGAIFLHTSDGARVLSNRITGNSAANDGGGLFCSSSHDLELVGNRTIGNTAGSQGFVGAGGGYRFDACRGVRLEREQIEGNVFRNFRVVTLSGGGISASGSELSIVDSTIAYNLAHVGAGIHALRNSRLSIDRVRLVANTAYTDGAVLYLDGARAALSNTVAARNLVGPKIAPRYDPGANIVLTGSARLDGWHNTIVGRRQDGLHVASPEASAALTDTIMSRLWRGVWVSAGRATMNRTLWHKVVQATSGLEPDGGARPLFGDPALRDDVHLDCGSDAIDRAFSARPSVDIDGDIRPSDAHPDIGADEAAGCALFLPGALVGRLTTVSEALASRPDRK